MKHTEKELFVKARAMFDCMDRIYLNCQTIKKMHDCEAKKLMSQIRKDERLKTVLQRQVGYIARELMSEE